MSPSALLRRTLAVLSGPARSQGDAVLAFLFFALVAGIGFAPIVAAPARVGVLEWDAYGNTWALTWVARHLASPQALFDANMFFPFPRSLTCTEGLFAQALQAAPLLAAGASPLLAYNVVWFLTFPLAGLGAYLLARHISGSRLGALLAGLSFAFSAYRVARIHHIQTLSFQWLPFYVLFLLLALERATRRRLILLALFGALQALSSGYYAAVLPLLTLIVLLFRWSAPGLKAVLATLALTALLLTPFFWPYYKTQAALAVGRSRAECAAWSARPLSPLRLHEGTLSPLRPLLTWLVPEGRPWLFPGGAVLLLGAGALALVRRKRETRLFLVLAATGFVLALGPDIRVGSLTLTGPYELLRQLPGYRSLRTPVRMYPVFSLALGTLAAMTWAALDRRWAWPRRLVPLIVVWAVVEALPRPRPAPGEIMPPPAYTRTLADAPRGVVLELPYDWRHDNAYYLYWSLAHGQRLVNGWGAFQPAAPAHLGDIGRRWPLPGVARELAEAGVRYVVVHTAALPERLRQRVLTTPLPRGVRLLQADAEGRRVYVLETPGRIQ